MADCIISDASLAAGFADHVNGSLKYGVIARQDREALKREFEALGPATQDATMKGLDQLRSRLSADGWPGKAVEISAFQTQLREIRSGTSAASCLSDKLKGALSLEGASNPIEDARRDIHEFQQRAMECRIDPSTCKAKP